MAIRLEATKAKKSYYYPPIPAPATCERCGVVFETSNKHQPRRFCTPECRFGRPKTEPGEKWCRECEQVFPTSEFFKRTKSSLDGLQNSCKACVSANARKESNVRTSRNTYLKRVYGITLEEYEARLAAQGGVCMICRATPESHDRIFNVDHDHGTGEVRGILCWNCNTGLGKFGENAETFLAGALYLATRGAIDRERWAVMVGELTGWR